MMIKKAVSPGILYVVAGAAAFGTIGVLGKTVMEYLPPITAVTMRVAIGAVFVFLYLLLRSGFQGLRIPRKQVIALLILGLNLSIGFSAYFFSLNLIQINQAVLLNYTAPIFAAFIAIPLLKERFSWKQGLALVLIILGLSLVVNAFGTKFEYQAVLGYSAGLLSGATYGLYFVLTKRFLRQYDPLIITFFSLLGSLPCLFVLSILLEGMPLEAIGRPQVFPYLLLLGFLPTAVSFIFLTRGIKLLRAGTASAAASFEPISAVALAFVFVGETIPNMYIPGAFLIILGVVLAGGQER